MLIAYFGATIIIGSSSTELTTGGLTTLVSYVMQIMMAVMLASMVYVMIIISRNSAERINEILNEMNWRMQQQGFDIKKYMQLTGQTEDQMRDMYREEARNNLKTELVIEEIIKGENIEADEKDTDAMLEEYAKAMGKTLEAVKTDFTEAQIAYFQHRSRINKVLDMMWDSAKVTDEQLAATAEPEQAAEPAKKPAAKKAVTKKAAAEKAEAETEGEQAAAPVAKAKKAPAKKATQDQAE